MIVYDKCWETMKRCGESTYTLINHYNISSGTIDRIRKGQGITTAKLDDFCQIFHCRVEDLITYVEPAEGEPHSAGKKSWPCLTRPMPPLPPRTWPRGLGSAAR